MYYIDVEHKGLGKFRRVTASDRYVAQQKAQAQVQVWSEQWRRRCDLASARESRTKHTMLKEGMKSEAEKRTDEAQHELSALRTIIADGVKVSSVLDWSGLRDKKNCEDPQPTSVGPEPLPNATKYLPRRSLLSWLLPGVRRKYEYQAEQLFKTDRDIWSTQISQWQAALAAWQSRKAESEAKKAERNAEVDAFHARYVARDDMAIKEYVDWVLSLSRYPDFFPKKWDMEFTGQTGILIVDYDLPPLDAMPKLKAVKFVQSRNAFEETYLRESEIGQLYDDVLYQTCLRSLYEMFSSDEADAIKSVTLNGWVDFVDRTNGNPSRSCIMSIQALKNEFQQINLSAVEPRACFRSLKGVGSAKLAGMSAVVPILRLNKNDERFIPAHDVIDSVQAATNIAAISWEEFEFLVRDLFEKEFSGNGGEVKITRASRDHGVDAVAFDPDPIRGGKIVIQAKRYTNVVGVSAVRDLYGTLINEGANRGILVTTSQYGPDSYAFAKDKPITLLDGGNLLSLLARHGHRARIDLAEAKRLGAERDEGLHTR